MEKKSFVRLGLGLAAAEIAVFAVMNLLTLAFRALFGPIAPSMSESSLNNLNAALYLFRDLVMYGTLIFVLWLFIHRLPGMPKQKKSAVSFGMIFFFFVVGTGVGFFISFPAFYIDKAFADVLKFIYSALFEPIFGALPEKTQPGEYHGLMRIAEIIIACVFAPIFEELMFRKVLLDKLRPFGDKTAILICGFAFGLTHLNFHQFLFATFGGFVFTYIMIKTNRLIYTILLHAAHNSISSLLFPFIQSGMDNAGLPNLGRVLSTGAALSLAVIGLAAFFTTLKKIELKRPAFRFSRRVGGGLVFGNAGSIIYLAVCFILFIYYALGLRIV